ncbi:MAG: glycoside hydrolase family 5 protein [Fibrobacter sp.]|nr:glycoside hydrolase family 5 protein [Fibrobacter sp.]
MNIRKISLPAAILSAALLPISTLVACSDDSSNSSSVEDPTGDNPGDPDIGGGTVIPSNPDIGDGPIIEVPETKDTTFLAPDEPAPEGGYTGTLTGVCEKGPFKAGSEVKLNFLDDALSPTGKSFSAKVSDDFGKYSLQYSGMTSYAMLEATGAFLNDILGDASATITLKSLIRAIDGETANVNVMTHLEAPRIAYLMKENGMSYAEAQGKAESEVLKAFHMKNFTVSARNISVLGTTDADGNLLAMSLLLQSEHSSAEMQGILDAVAADIEKDGTWDDAATRAKISDWAYLQKMDELSYYLENISPALPSFDQKFRTFWFQEFGLGVCDSTIQGKLVENSNQLSEYYTKSFVCADSTWRIASASALQNREGTALFGECTDALEGTVKEGDGKKFICKKSNWNYASDAELLNIAVAAASGACTSANNGSVVKYESGYVLCQNSTWKKLNTTPVDYSKGRAMNKKLGQGINLGNAWESKGTKGSSADCGWNNCIKDEYFKVIKDAGFKSVRLPVRWNYDAEQNAPYTLDNGRLSGVKADIDLALAQGLVVIVNFHHYEELNNYAVYYDNNPSGYENEKKRFLGMWEQVAKAMDTYGDDQVVLEILNEPHDMKNKQVDDLMMSAYEVIRKNAPGKTIMFEGNGYSKFAQISNVQLPADGNIIFTGHYYEPFSFTHQGHGYDCGTRLRDSDISKMPSQFKAYVDSALVHFPDINGGHIPMNMGEFGVSTCGGNGPTSEERAKWTEAAIKAAESYGMSWHYWGLTGVGGFEAYSGSWNSNLLDVFKKYL